MMVFLVTTIIFLIAVGGMSVGVIISNRRIQGSCGGLANMKDSDGKTMCEVCVDPAPDCSGDPALENCPPELLANENHSSSV
jgi:hypothetical protein